MGQEQLFQRNGISNITNLSGQDAIKLAHVNFGLDIISHASSWIDRL